MRKHNIVSTKEVFSNRKALIGALVKARNFAFNLERSKEVDLQTFVDQSQHFASKDLGAVVRLKISEYAKTNKTENPKVEANKYGTKYLSNQDMAINSVFTRIPRTFSDIISYFKDLKEDSESHMDIAEAIEEDIEKATSKIKKEIEGITLLQTGIKTENDRLKEILAYSLQGQEEEDEAEDEDQAEEEDEASKKAENEVKGEEAEETSYLKHYRLFLASITVLEDICTWLDGLYEEIVTLKNELDCIINYYNALLVTFKKFSQELSQGVNSQKILSQVEELIDKLENKLEIIEVFTESLS